MNRELFFHLFGDYYIYILYNFIYIYIHWDVKATIDAAIPIISVTPTFRLAPNFRITRILVAQIRQAQKAWELMVGNGMVCPLQNGEFPNDSDGVMIGKIDLLFVGKWGFHQDKRGE